MFNQRRFVFGLGLLVGFIVTVLAVRPARIRNAQVTAVSPGDVPLAHVALRYSGGQPPVSVIVDVVGAAQNGGSATISGEQLFVEVPLHGAVDSAWRVVTTAYYRLPFGTREERREHGA